MASKAIQTGVIRIGLSVNGGVDNINCTYEMCYVTPGSGLYISEITSLWTYDSLLLNILSTMTQDVISDAQLKYGIGLVPGDIFFYSFVRGQ